MKNKRGMYIVEASIILPIFIAAMVMIISIIPLISKCENVVFSCADELRLDSARAGTGIKGSFFPGLAVARVSSENAGISIFSVNSYKKGVKRNGIEDLITVRFTCGFVKGLSIIPVDSIRFSGNLTSRAFTGSAHTVKSGADDNTVYVFPEDGVRYHKKGCRYLSAHCHLTILSEELMTKYHACPLCNAKKAHIGSTVVCFERAGEAYHTQGCRQVEKEKYYTETTRSSAERAGYSPCSVCGG